MVLWCDIDGVIISCVFIRWEVRKAGLEWLGSLTDHSKSRSEQLLSNHGLIPWFPRPCWTRATLSPAQLFGRRMMACGLGVANLGKYVKKYVGLVCPLSVSIHPGYSISVSMPGDLLDSSQENCVVDTLQLFLHLLFCDCPCPSLFPAWVSLFPVWPELFDPCAKNPLLPQQSFKVRSLRIWKWKHYTFFEKTVVPRQISTYAMSCWYRQVAPAQRFLKHNILMQRPLCQCFSLVTWNKAV